MPYKIKKASGGFKVTTPNHPQGFSKKPQTKQMAKKQMAAIRANTKEPLAGGVDIKPKY